jgi:hypothetical protein
MYHYSIVVHAEKTIYISTLTHIHSYGPAPNISLPCSLPSADTKTKPYADILRGLPRTNNQLLTCYLAPVGRLVALFKSTGNGM